MDIVDDIILEETGGKPNGGFTNDPADSGGLTKWGISQVANPEAWKNGPPSYDQARALYTQKYLKPFEGIRDSGLLHQLVDFGVTAGPETAARILQQIVGVTPDGHVGPDTVKAVEAYSAGTIFGVPVPGFVLLNLAVRDARVMFYAGIAKGFPKNLKFLLGWLKRAMEFK